MLLGDFAAARTHFEQAIALYDPEQHPSLIVSTGDPRVDCLSFVSWALQFLGYPDQALKRSREAVALAEELSNPFHLAYTLAIAAMFHLLRREAQLARERAEEVITRSTEQGAPYWLAVGTLARGGALSLQGQGKEGMPQLRQGLAARQATGAEAYGTQVLALLAEACGKVGQAEEGLRVLAEALALVDKIGERFYEAELYRLKGELTLQKLSVIGAQLSETDPQPLTPDPQGEAEACFLKAIDIARQQQAKSWELRAATSLARLWQRQGKTHEAHRMLSEIYNWFTEGFDTKDLQEAKALFEELS